MVVTLFWVAFLLIILGAMLWTVRTYVTPDPAKWLLQGIIVLGMLYVLAGLMGLVPLPRPNW